MRTFMSVSAVLVACLAFGAQGVSAATDSQTLQVQPNPVEAGATITVTGAGWGCGVDVLLTLFGPGLPEDGLDLAEVTPSPVGGLSYETTAPTEPGMYSVVATYTFECIASAEAEFSVTAPPTSPPTTPAPTTEAPTTTEAPSPTEAPTEEPTTTVTDLLPPTGTSSAAGPLALVALVLLGAGAILVTRSRSTDPS